MKTSTTASKMFLAAATLFVGGAYSQTVGPTVGIGSLQPVNNEEIAEAQTLVNALEMDDAITVGRPVEVGELLCDTLEAAEDARHLTFVISPTERITAERTIYEVVSGEVFSDGIGRKIWMGQVTNESEDEQRNGLPMTVSMTWGDKCDVETFLLKATKKNGDGSIKVIKTIPCHIGSDTDICLVETNIASDLEEEPTPAPVPDVNWIPDDVIVDNGDGPFVLIKVMMLYSDTAKQNLGGISNFQMETELAQALTRSTLAMEVSEIPLQFTVVYCGQTPDGQDLTLGELVVDSDVAAWRDQVEADLVQAFVALPPKICGSGKPYSSNKSSGFSVAKAICLDQESHTHEFGHNLGCGHDLGNGGNGLHPYSHGKKYCTGDLRFRTIMSYPCEDGNGNDVYGPRANIFSSPDLDIIGTPTGTSDEDNRLTIISTMIPVAANY